MGVIGDRLLKIKNTLPTDVTLVAVSKYHPEEELMDAYQTGHRIFGENIVQELCRKHEALPKDIQWHFIGHLQSNKVKYIAPFITMIHAVDSFSLLQEINKQAAKSNRVIPCLLQLHIATEETKFGFTPQECMEMLEEGQWKMLQHVNIVGIMGIASNVDDPKQIHQEFQQLKAFFQETKKQYFMNDESFRHCSWGMSADYPIALEEGSNMVRIGTTIFGARNYNK